MEGSEISVKLEDLDFRDCVNFVLESEGSEYVKHVGEDGSKYGIRNRLYQKYYGTSRDVKDAVIEEAYYIYFLEFWEPYPYKEIQDKHIMKKIFDMSVHMGVSRAHKIVQDVLKRFGFDLKIDGIMGVETLNSLNSKSLDPVKFYHGLCLRQWDYYKDVLLRNPSKLVYERGWFLRACK